MASKIISLFLVAASILLFQNCQKNGLTDQQVQDSNQSSQNIQNLQSLSGKKLLLKKYLNKDQVEEVREPYVYSVEFGTGGLSKDKTSQALIFSGPPSDCNSASTIYSISKEGTLEEATQITTLMGCNFRYNLDGYYLLPTRMSLQMGELGELIVINLEDQSQAIFQVLTSADTVPVNKLPPNVSL